jgi:hypothetical protein
VEPHLRPVVKRLEALDIDALQLEQRQTPSYNDASRG